MHKKTVLWLLIAVALVLGGAILFGGVMISVNWNFGKLSTVAYETNEYSIHEVYQNISVVTDTADVVFLPADEAECRVVCHEQSRAKHTVSVRDGTLVIELVDTRKWYEYIGVNFDTDKVTVWVPSKVSGNLSLRADTGDVEISEALRFASMDVSVSTGNVHNRASVAQEMKIRATTGDISVEAVSAGSMMLSVTTGKVTVSDVKCTGEVSVGVSTGKARLTNTTCANLTSDGNTGSIWLKNVVAAETLCIERTTGDVTFDGCDAGEITVITDTGNVTGSLLSEKVFVVQTDTGRIQVPATTTGGTCRITTDPGDIQLHIAQ